MHVCGAKLFSKMLSRGQNPQLHTVTLHLVCGIKNGGGVKKRGAQEETEGWRVRGRKLGWRDGRKEEYEVGKGLREKYLGKKKQTAEMKDGGRELSAECVSCMLNKQMSA